MYAEVIFMADYKAMYYKLFNKVSDVICDLQEIQQLCEEMYIESEEENLTKFRLTNSKNNDEKTDKTTD